MFNLHEGERAANVFNQKSSSGNTSKSAASSSIIPPLTQGWCVHVREQKDSSLAYLHRIYKPFGMEAHVKMTPPSYHHSPVKPRSEPPFARRRSHPIPRRNASERFVTTSNHEAGRK